MSRVQSPVSSVQSAEGVLSSHLGETRLVSTNALDPLPETDALQAVVVNNNRHNERSTIIQCLVRAGCYSNLGHHPPSQPPPQH